MSAGMLPAMVDAEVNNAVYKVCVCCVCVCVCVSVCMHECVYIHVLFFLSTS